MGKSSSSLSYKRNFRREMNSSSQIVAFDSGKMKGEHVGSRSRFAKTYERGINLSIFWRFW